MKVALYARVSTTEKQLRRLKNMEERVKQDPEVQLSKLRAFCRDRGYEVFDEYVDRVSGATSNRPDLDRMLDDARHHKFDAIVIVRLDRMMRSTRNLLNIMKNLEEWNVNLTCTDQPIETNSAIGKLMITLLGAVAEFERELASERVKDSIEKRRRDGKSIGRPKRINLDIEEIKTLIIELDGNVKNVARIKGVTRSAVYRILIENGVDIEELRKEIS